MSKNSYVPARKATDDTKGKPTSRRISPPQRNSRLLCDFPSLHTFFISAYNLTIQFFQRLRSPGRISVYLSFICSTVRFDQVFVYLVGGLCAVVNHLLHCHILHELTRLCSSRCSNPRWACHPNLCREPPLASADIPHPTAKFHFHCYFYLRP